MKRGGTRRHRRSPSRIALRHAFGAAAALVAASVLGSPADRFANVEVKAVPVAGAVHMIQGAGGNIGVSVGEDGVLMVDSQFEPLAERVLAAIEEVGGGTPRLVLNTHFHGDHVGGNAFFARDGTVLAHRNVRLRMAGCAPGATSCDTADAPGLPMVTFDDRLRLYFNGDEVDVIHLPRGHTDGDVVVWFKDSKAIHMGDHLFHARFPFVDVASGGSVDGLLANLERVLDMLPADTKVIAGHGPLGGVKDIRAMADMIGHSLAAVAEAVDENALEALKRDGIEGYEDWSWNFISVAQWVDTIVASEAARTTAP